MFSFNDYKEIIRIIKSTDRYMDYHKALHSDKFILSFLYCFLDLVYISVLGLLSNFLIS